MPQRRQRSIDQADIGASAKSDPDELSDSSSDPISPTSSMLPSKPPSTPTTPSSKTGTQRGQKMRKNIPQHKAVTFMNQADAEDDNKFDHTRTPPSRSSRRTHARSSSDAGADNGGGDETTISSRSPRHKRHTIIVSSDSEGIGGKMTGRHDDASSDEADDAISKDASPDMTKVPGSSAKRHTPIPVSSIPEIHSLHLRGDGSGGGSQSSRPSHSARRTQSLRSESGGSNAHSARRKTQSPHTSGRCFWIMAALLGLISIPFHLVFFTTLSTPKTDSTVYRYQSWEFPSSGMPDAMPVTGDGHLDVSVAELVDSNRLVIQPRPVSIENMVVDMVDAYARAFVAADMRSGLPGTVNATNMTLGGVYYHAKGSNTSQPPVASESGHRVASLNMTLAVVAAWDLTRYVGHVTSDLINLTMDHLSTPNETERTTLLQYISPKAFLRKDGLQGACTQVFDRRWVPRRFSHEPVNSVARWLEHLADRFDERPGFSRPSEDDVEAPHIGTKIPSGTDLRKLGPDTKLPEILSQLPISSDAKFSVHAASWSLAREHMAQPLSALCEDADVLALVARGECPRHTEASPIGGPNAVPGHHEVGVHNTLCTLDQELRVLVQRIAHIRRRLGKIDDMHRAAAANTRQTPHDATEKLDEKLAADAADRKRAHLDEYKTRSNLVLDQAMAHINTYIRPNLALQRRVIQDIAARFLKPCTIHNNLRRSLILLFAQQSAWWTLEWNPDAALAELNLVTIPQLNSSRLRTAASAARNLLGDLPAAYAVDSSLSFQFTSYPSGSYNAQWITDAGFGYKDLAHLQNLIREQHSQEMFYRTQDERYMQWDWVAYERDFIPDQCFKEEIPDHW